LTPPRVFQLGDDGIGCRSGRRADGACCPLIEGIFRSIACA
jgi:hypothetical protein